MREIPVKFFGAIVFFILCVILVTRDSPANRRQDQNKVTADIRYYAFEKSCPYSEGQILDRVGEVEEDLKSVQKDLKEYRKKRKNENI